jgi:hypothetical protein
MLFEIARALRSLTRSPITSALHEARRLARPHFHFEEGGVTSVVVKPPSFFRSRTRTSNMVSPGDFSSGNRRHSMRLGLIVR